MPEAKKAALKALALDETVAEAHAALGFVLHFYDWDWAGAELEYRRALELNPEEPQARRSYPVLLVDLGRVEESVAEARSSVERDPVSAFYRYILAHVLTLARRFEEVIAEARAGFEFDPSFHLFYNALGLGLAGLGRRDDTVEVSRQGEVAAPGVPLVQAQLGWALGLAGERREALAILEDLKRRRSEGYFSGVLVAWVCVGLATTIKPSRGYNKLARNATV